MAEFSCSNNSSHQFDAMTVDGFCPQPECYGVGFLIESNAGGSGGTSSGSEAGVREIGLCILLMDASGSMKEPAFVSSPTRKDQLVAGSASGGIFELEQLSNKDDAYVIAVMFDTSANVIFADSIAEIFRRFGTAPEFSKFLSDNFSSGGTDINKALIFAKEIYDDFIQRGDLSKYGGPSNVRPIKQSVLNAAGDQKIVPNVRVLIYTDGEDVVAGKINGNPFKNEEVDVLMGAFFGQGEEDGCRELKGILSKCPIHDFDQFFLINDPSRIQTMRKLFRMASGASGFCPMCLAHDR